MKQNMDLVMAIANKTGLYGKHKFTTISLSKKMPMSQQTISRKLISLEKKGYLKREASTGGITISLTDKTRKILREAYETINRLFLNTEILKGNVFTGLGEGRFYMSQPGYIKQFEDKLGITKPFKGTLNLKVAPNDAKAFLENKEPIKIEGFKTKERAFGEITAYKVTINQHKAALLVPRRSSHKENVVEIIADFNIREHFVLKDNSQIDIR